MKVVIQVPCYNEAEYFPATLADLPRSLDAVDEIEIIVIDDGSSDDTTRLARAAGAQRLILAVDAANEPAIAAYGTAGFSAWDRRSVFMRRFA